MADYRCPQCGNEVTFEVQAETVRMVQIDGESNCTHDPGGDIEWSDDSLMECQVCQHAATVAQFERPKIKAGDQVQIKPRISRPGR